MSPLFLIRRTFLDPIDLFIGPIVFIFLFLISFVLTIRLNKRQKFLFFGGLFLKFIGGILFALIYNYYYRGGDTWLYHLDAKLIANTFYSDPIIGLKLILQSPENYSGAIKIAANKSFSGYIYSPNSNLLIRIAGLIGIFTFNSYIGIAAILGFYSFIGMWLFYKTFQKKYPHLELELAIATLFIPSIWFWAGGVMKDTLALGACGYFVYAINNLFIDRRRIILSILIILVNINIALSSKAYIIYMLAPSTLIWIIITYWSRIKAKVARIVSLPIVLLLIGLMVGAGIYYMPVLIGTSIEMIVKEIETTGTWITKVSEKTGGSSYSLGEIDYSPAGLLKVSPKAIFVTLYQPFLWQASNPPMLLAALEALLTFLFTFYVIIKVGFMNFTKRLLTNPDVAFCIVFALGFAFFTGISSLNFGSLARYKLPVFPFYFTAMYIILKGIEKKKNGAIQQN